MELCYGGHPAALDSLDVFSFMSLWFWYLGAVLVLARNLSLYIAMPFL